MQYHIGTMGFSYADWRGVFYPEGVQAGDFLRAYAQAFDAVELDTTFHAIPAPDRVEKWARSAPAQFRFLPKTPRQITHDAPLAFGTAGMRAFLGALEPMRAAGKLGPILIQFPPAFTAAELPELGAFLRQLPAAMRYAVEFRHPSWETPATLAVLAEQRCAMVTGDYSADPFPIHVTTDFLYLRFIGTHNQYKGHARERVDMTERLAWWLEQVNAAVAEAPGRVTTLYAMFNNDYAGHAPATANRFRTLVNLPPGEIASPGAADQGKLF